MCLSHFAHMHAPSFASSSLAQLGANCILKTRPNGQHPHRADPHENPDLSGAVKQIQSGYIPRSTMIYTLLGSTAPRSLSAILPLGSALSLHPCIPSIPKAATTSTAPPRESGVIASGLDDGMKSDPTRARGIVRDSPTVATDLSADCCLDCTPSSDELLNLRIGVVLSMASMYM